MFAKFWSFWYIISLTSIKIKILIDILKWIDEVSPIPATAMSLELYYILQSGIFFLLGAFPWINLLCTFSWHNIKGPGSYCHYLECVVHQSLSLRFYIWITGISSERTGPIGLEPNFAKRCLWVPIQKSLCDPRKDMTWLPWSIFLVLHWLAETSKIQFCETIRPIRTELCLYGPLQQNLYFV